MPRLSNAKWEKFCQEYVRDPNATRAYKAAGYNVRSDDAACAAASRLLNRVKVAERLAELQEEAKDKAVADAREIRETLTRILRGETEEEQIVVIGVGNGRQAATTRMKAPSHADRMKAADLLNKMGGNYDNTLSVTLDVPQFSGSDELED